MSVQIRAKGLTLKDSTKAHIENAIAAFEKFGLDITKVQVVLDAEKKGVHVEFNIHVAHEQPVIINQHDDDLDAAIDLAIDRATNALGRLHDKLADHKKTSIKDLEVEA